MKCIVLLLTIINEKRKINDNTMKDIAISISIIKRVDNYIHVIIYTVCKCLLYASSDLGRLITVSVGSTKLGFSDQTK